MEIVNDGWREDPIIVPIATPVYRFATERGAVRSGFHSVGNLTQKPQNTYFKKR